MFPTINHTVSRCFLACVALQFVAVMPCSVYGQTQITAVTTTNLTVSATSYVVNGKTVNHGEPVPGDDLRLDEFTAGGLVYVYEQAADQIAIRRYDPPVGGPPGTPFGIKHTVYYEGTYASNIADIPPRRVLSEEEALFNRALRRGSNNTFDNDRGAVISNNLERIDYIFNSGLTVDAALLTLAGFPVFERSGGNAFGIAAITSLDGGGTPNGYAPLVQVSNNTGPLVVPAYAYVDFKQEDGETLLEPLTQGSMQGVKGVFVSLQDLGITGGQTFYGYSLFGEDVTAGHNLVNYQGFPKTETGGADLVGGGHFYLETNQTLPVELTSFDVILNGRHAHLAWETASETNNAGFFVEMRRGNESFVSQGFVEGNGTTGNRSTYHFVLEALTPGRYTFRLKQIDYDGTFEYHPEVEVVVELGERFLLEPVFPNPFYSEAHFRFAVGRQQSVRVDLYDMLGRRVRTLYSGSPAVGQVLDVRLDGESLPSGHYVLRFATDDTIESQAVTKLK